MNPAARTAAITAVAFLGPILAVTAWHWHDLQEVLIVEPGEVSGQLLYFTGPT